MTRTHTARMARWTRRAWDCNPADPTAAVSWTRTYGPVTLVLTGIWDVESRLSFRRWTWRTYGTAVFSWWYGRLEDRWQQAQPDDREDPMGPASWYE